MIDFDITLTAATKVTFGDAKDGLFGIRVAPSMQEVANTGRGITDKGPHTGEITNADGARKEKALWGKPSDWVDYAGIVEGEKVGITIFDHAGNAPRTRWHARGYGLFAANPFGQTAFGDKDKDGSVTLEPGGKLRLRYRVVFHGADTGAEQLAKIWKAYSVAK